MDDKLTALLVRHELMKSVLKQRLNYFKKTGEGNESSLFAELCFCLCTPQSKAKACDTAVKSLTKSGDLLNGSEEQIKKHLLKAGVRFHHNKSRYIVNARIFFTEQSLKSKILSETKLSDLREWLVKNVKGLGMKESSHFLRNIGIYGNLAILDRHILKNMVKYKIIRNIPKSLTKKKYLHLEKKLNKFAEKIKIPSEELDLLFWSEETGEVFK